ncbi:MAG: hypothetical protein P0S94_02060 [Simkaniaceae bacterium]|nr:hypothetical protein [Simkaniaceae bacterium]
MKKGHFIRFFICLVTVAMTLFAYLEKQNTITTLAMQIPEKERALKNMQEEITHLRYQIEQFESPEHLLSLVRTNAYSHLKHASTDEVAALDEGIALEMPKAIAEPKALFKPRLVIGAGP